ncbi:MAG: hypothetical protein IJY09_05495 [Lachnospiraceae bacterium]|nr:hypothetical protein [Lachnospiraceae bacterium]
MMLEQNNQSFEYTYSAERQVEIEKIKRKYMTREEDKLEQLRKMDEAVARPGTIWSLVIGIVGCLLFGVGMCCSLVWAEQAFVLGIVVGILGMVLMGCAYPVYKKVSERERERMAPQILALADELLKSER